MSNTSSTSTSEHYIRPYTDLDGETIETIWLPSSAKEAKARGESLYWTGKACLRGHVAPRYASTGNCMRCKRERNRTPEARECRRQWRKENREKIREYDRKRDRTPERREYKRRWAAENPDHNAALQGKADAERRAPGCTPEGFDIEPTIPIYAKARRLTEETGTQYHVDHGIPLVLGGRHEASNLRVVTAEENRAKGAIERKLASAATGADPVERFTAVWRDLRDDLIELVGEELASRIRDAGMEVARETEEAHRRAS